jgi:hypothetical protein
MVGRFRKTRREGQESGWDFGDSTQFEVVHQDGDSGWSLWNEVSRVHENRFAETVPGAPPTVPMPLEEKAWSDTQPAGEALKPTSAAQPVAPRQPAGVTLEEALRFVRARGRVCPLPAAWEQLSALLPRRSTKGGVEEPPRPITGRAWDAAPTRAKRATFLEQVEWASRTGVLQQVMDFLHALPEGDWLYAGER